MRKKAAVAEVVAGGAVMVAAGVEVEVEVAVQVEAEAVEMDICMG